MKPHEFRELVNDIREITVICMHKCAPEPETLWYWLKKQAFLQTISEDNIHRIFCTCKAYYNAGQLREQIIKALNECGIKPNHENTLGPGPWLG